MISFKKILQRLLGSESEEDKEWKWKVVEIANYHYFPLRAQAAKDYLWKEENWERLKETTHGKFLREVVSPAPDLGYRALLREQLLEKEPE